MRHIILNVHGLGTPQHALDPGEDRYWVEPDVLAEAIALAERYKDRVRTTFTFDDGNLSDLEVGAPLLTQAGHNATFFVLSSRIGATHYLSEDDIKQLQKMGHKIGSHGADHVDWCAQDEAGLTRELDTARDEIAQVAGHEITEVGIPFGRYNGRVMRALRARGYQAAYCSDDGAVRTGAWPAPRTSLTAGMTCQEIQKALLETENPVTGLLRRARIEVRKRF